MIHGTSFISKERANRSVENFISDVKRRLKRCSRSLGKTANDRCIYTNQRNSWILRVPHHDLAFENIHGKRYPEFVIRKRLSNRAVAIWKIARAHVLMPMVNC